MSDEMIPGLVLAVAGAAAWVVALTSTWLSPLLPPPAGAPFRALRAGPAASAAGMWIAVCGAIWMAAASRLS